MRQYLFALTASMLVTACGSSTPDRPPRDFLDTPMAASSSGQTSSCYRLRQLLLTRKALGLTLEWRQLDEATWELIEMRHTEFDGLRPDARNVYRRTNNLIYLVEAANINRKGEQHALDVRKLTENHKDIFEHYSDLTPIPGCA